MSRVLNGTAVVSAEKQARVREAVRVAVEPHVRDALRRRAAPSIAHMSWDAVARGFASTLSALIERHTRSHPPNPLRVGDDQDLKQRIA